uniref:Uncharacterized protein n=1 Tax=Kwoniella pini CBS 10737 TaxID=1296096 RepID=A0A1B9HWV6_9TREE|nr:uncharacterized protein I206_06664 [Kwoniella pini CBS 10737]OCF47757.1 hypothetical protein I206_06664 [Kwoniella pini CBS 10737]
MARPIQDAIMLLGDSITSRQDVPLSLNALLSETYRRNFDILNRGLGGYNTKFYLPSLNEFFLNKEEEKRNFILKRNYQKIKLITIWFGANDSVLPEFIQYVPLEEFIKNINLILEKITFEEKENFENKNNKNDDDDDFLNIILITPPPILEKMMENQEFSNQRKLKNTKKYAEGILNIGKQWQEKEKENSNKNKKWKIRTIDMFNGILNDAGGTEDQLKPYFIDGLHLSTKGYEVLWKKLLPILENDFKGRGISPSEIEFTIPE